MSAGAQISNYGWIYAAADEERKIDIEKSNGVFEDGAMAEDNNAQEIDIPQVVDAFKKDHPSFKVELESEGETIRINVRAESLTGKPFR